MSDCLCHGLFFFQILLLLKRLLGTLWGLAVLESCYDGRNIFCAFSNLTYRHLKMVKKWTGVNTMWLVPVKTLKSLTSGLLR